MYILLQKVANVYVVVCSLVICSSLSAADLSLCAVMKFNETSVKRRFLNAEWKVMFHF